MIARTPALVLLMAACGGPAAPAPATAPAPAPSSPASGQTVRFDGPIRAISARPDGGFRVGVGDTIIALGADGTRGATETHPHRIDALSSEQRHEMVLLGGALQAGALGPMEAPAGVTAMAASYDRAFGIVGDGIRDLRDGEVLGPAPEGASSLLANGGTLVIGHDAGLSALSLASREVTELAAVGPVRGLALDHEGHYVAAVEGAGWVRVAPDGETTPLREDGPVGALAFDATSRRLATVVGERVHLTDYLPLVGQDAATWTARDARPMRPFEAGPYALSGGEYWPYRGDREPDYPADVLWGFYPEAGVTFEGEAPRVSATPAAVACAERSFAALQTFLADPPAELAAALDETTSPRFYLWVNDYSEAVDPFPEPRRPARLWYWRRNPQVAGRVPGYWKWETTLAQDGTCEIPDPSQTDWAAVHPDA